MTVTEIKAQNQHFYLIGPISMIATILIIFKYKKIKYPIVFHDKRLY